MICLILDLILQVLMCCLLIEKKREINSGDVQGPINREPEEKLDPSLKQQQQQQSGIRRLYVVDSNNLIVVVIDSYFISSFFTSSTTSKSSSSLSPPHLSSSSPINKPLSALEQPKIEPTYQKPASRCNGDLTREDEEVVGDDSKTMKRRHIDPNMLYLCIFMFNLLFFMFTCFDLACLPKLLLATLLLFLKDKPSLFLFTTSLLFLFNDKCAKLIRPTFKTRRRSFYLKSSKRTRLKDSSPLETINDPS